MTGGCSHHQPPSPSTLHLLQTRLFCLPLVRRTNRAQRKNIQSRVKNSRVVVVVVVVASVVVSNGCWLVQSGSGSGGAHRIESPSETPPVFTPHPILLCSTVTRDEGRWRWRSNRPCLQRNATPLSNFQVRWNNKMPRITYSKSMAPYLGRTKGWVGSRYPVHPPTTRTRERGRRG